MLEQAESKARAFKSGLSDSRWRGQRRQAFDQSFSKVTGAIKRDVDQNKENKTSVQHKITELEHQKSSLERAISRLESAME
ncbi:hypothetical protein FD35_GL001910 [Furfurilactobacillus rossiae DSM 15814]|uniref:DUF5082 domain-containing protein n=2 Tax=Furfurilactobacillus rossiae TaxID=231049 RepID=A0A0R1RG32_9LACO|nr:hypothetical protein FD35_GL001910 [Furfurilactobacillus rossiae DSM 15814]